MRDHHGSLQLYAGAVRKVWAPKPGSRTQQQIWLSVSSTESTAKYLCHPWAQAPGAELACIAVSLHEYHALRRNSALGGHRESG
jgi:hypothetical protein